MPMKIPASDTASLNMTPMIDIVFNLVTFFMLTLDMSQKELAVLDLPRANGGIEDKDPTTAVGASPKTNPVHHQPRAEGTVYFKGERWSLVRRGPQEAGPGAREPAPGAPRAHPPAKLREADGSSKVMVLIRGDRSAKWKYVQWIMQVCADPNIKIYKMHFAVEHKPKE